MVSKKKKYLCEVKIEKSGPRDHRLSSLGKPRDAKRRSSGRIFLFYPHTHDRLLYSDVPSVARGLTFVVFLFVHILCLRDSSYAWYTIAQRCDSTKPRVLDRNFKANIHQILFLTRTLFSVNEKTRLGTDFAIRRHDCACPYYIGQIECPNCLILI